MRNPTLFDQNNDKNTNSNRVIFSSDDSCSLKKYDSEQSLASCSSFSLQDCIDEFKARKARRTVSQSKSQDAEDKFVGTSEDRDIIIQNRSNKQNEKLYKPCKNGFCYCFTSDSDEVRRSHNPNQEAKNTRRARKLDGSNQYTEQHSIKPFQNAKQNIYQSYPEKSQRKTITQNAIKIPPKISFDQEKKHLVAISKLKEIKHESSTTKNGPLIKITQEIHDNCVISEVCVNRNLINKLRTNFDPTSQTQTKPKAEHSNSSDSIREISPKVFHTRENCPVKRDISEIESLNEEFMSTTLNTSSRDSGSKKRTSTGGRLLKKRLSQTQKEIKPRNLAIPPKKPPRNIRNVKSSSSSCSTTPSLREANRILDDFLRSKGVDIPAEIQRSSNKRKSFPLEKTTQTDINHKRNFSLCPIPSCPSLSDIERKAQPTAKSVDKELVRNHVIGWCEPKVAELLSMDTSSKKRNFQSNFSQVGPQTPVTKLAPKQTSRQYADRQTTTERIIIPPKQDIDTVDGNYHNLAANMQSKSTPVKSEIFDCNKKSDNHKSIFKEQLSQIVQNSPFLSKKNECTKPKTKSNLKSSSSFLNASKKKILKFVGKETTTHTRSVGVQTMISRQLDAGPCLQSPPGSYFSSRSTTTPTTTPSKSKGSQTEFDFSRTIKSPPKKDKSTQRKLNFPLINAKQQQLTKTYQSYHSDLDKDVSISKMGYILSGIRAKLEASDERALCTFRDLERREHRSDAVDCVDARIHDALRLSVPVYVQTDNAKDYEDPIYSEIEEDSFVISGSPVLENAANAVDHFSAESDPTAIYAKIMKKSNKNMQNEAAAQTRTYQSFNNIQEMGNDSLPQNHKCNIDLNVVLQRSVCSIQNLDRSRMCGLNKSFGNLERISNPNLEVSYTSVDSGSLDESKTSSNDLVTVVSTNEIPDGAHDNRFVKSSTALNLNHINQEDRIAANDATLSSLSINQCTPRKKSYPIHLTQLLLDADESTIRRTISGISKSCPPTPHNLPSKLIGDEYPCDDESKSLNENLKLISTPKMLRVLNLTDKIRKSFRRSKNYLKSESKRISTSFQGNHKLNENKLNELSSSIGIDKVFAVDEDAPVEIQLAQAVQICRKLPDLEISREMVEAERLLLFSSLKNLTSQKQIKLHQKKVSPVCFYIDGLRLPITTDRDQDSYFKYFYIGVFTCGNQVISTQSVECVNHEAIFRDCDISFVSSNESEEVHCDIFMLRLRVVSPVVKMQRSVSPESLNSSIDDIVSRFRLHGRFVIRPINFVPYQYDSEQSVEKAFIRLNSYAKQCAIPVTRTTEDNNLPNVVQMDGRATMRFRKFHHSGFLNVQDSELRYNWNRRWCVLDGLLLIVREDNSICTERDVITSFDLTRCCSALPIECAPRDVCARPRTFRLNQLSSEHFEHSDRSSSSSALEQSEFFFSADNLTDLNNWLLKLNEVLNFINKWMR